MSGVASLPGVVLGGNVFGWTADEETSFAVLDAALDAGLTSIDTADVYSAWAHDGEGGQSEAIIGRWLASRGVRDRVHLATKAGMHPGADDLRPATLRRQTEASLRRLGVDTIDLHYFHKDDGGDLAEALGTMAELRAEGKVAEVGLSNFSRERIDEALAAGADVPITALQPQYSLMERGIEDEGLLDCGLAVLPYSSLASGFLSGKYRAGQDAPASQRAGKAAAYLEDPRGPRVLEALDQVAAAHDGAPVAAVALAWLRGRPGVAAPIASARTVEQVAPLAAALALELTADEEAMLTAASAA